MIIELCCPSHHINYKDLIEGAFLSTDHGFDAFYTPVGYSSRVKPYFKHESIKTLTRLGAMIDYPRGDSPTPVKLHGILQAIQNECDLIDVVINHSFILNNDFVNFLKDITTCVTVCTQNNVELRFIVDYKLFDIETYAGLCLYIKNKTGISTIVSSTGVFADDPIENVIACAECTKHGIKMICYSTMLSKQHIQLLIDSKIFAGRFNYSAQSKDI